MSFKQSNSSTGDCIEKHDPQAENIDGFKLIFKFLSLLELLFVVKSFYSEPRWVHIADNLLIILNFSRIYLFGDISKMITQKLIFLNNRDYLWLLMLINIDNAYQNIQGIYI